MTTALRTALLVGALTLLLAAPASASKTQESIFEDEQQLLERGPDVRNATLDDIDALGADTIRSLVLWSRIAPAGSRRPKGFTGASPAAYPAAAWDPYDDLVRGANVRGIGLLLSPSTPIPAWASDCKSGVKATCKPDPKLFGDFVTALGARYSGTYADENQGGGVLPRVTRWSFGNEPNQPGWLTPQYERKSGRLVASAAVRYRQLAAAAIKALRASGHGADQMLLGETAPIGRTSGSLSRRPIPPVEFLRKLFCLDSRGHRLSGADGRAHSCSGFRRLAVTGFAHHPYQRGGSRPPAEPPQAAGEITISAPSRLRRLLTQAGRASRIPRSLPVFYTEFGFQTNPPDRIFGVRVALQADYVNQSDWMAYRDSSVKSVAQYKLVDETAISSFQSGLRFIDGSPKPAYEAYRLPIWVTRSGSNVRVYGQVRPAADSTPQQVDIQVKPAGGSFATVQTVTVSSLKGHFLQTLPARSGTWRLSWNGLVSREAKVARR
ncbi:MAG: hypothetical protein ACXWZK_06400 [Solirubrobacterales bacterium]